MNGTSERGINRVAWNLRMDGPRIPRLAPPTEEESAFFTPQGSEVLPGTYTVRVKAGGVEAMQTVEVLPDPRVNIPMADRQAKFELIQKVTQRIEVVAEAVDRIVRMRRSIDAALEQARERNDEPVRQLRTAADSLRKRLTAVADLFIAEPNRVQGLTRNVHTVSAKLMAVRSSLTASWDAPNSTQTTNLRQAEAALESALKEFNKVFSEDIPAFKQKVDAAKLTLFPEQEPLNMDWRPRRRE